ncbi:MAG TPA: S41 family peptidase [Bacteroidales bacterium]|nr:S41 family peptidase [Bacteroidales bacterium]
MQKIALLLLIFTIHISCFSQQNMDEAQKLATLCKVWGFLKYHHPKVAKGQYDWDKELVKKIPYIKSASTKNEINKIYFEWLKSLGKISECKKCKNIDSAALTYNLNHGWLTDTSIFVDDVIAKLNYIKDNRIQKQHYYIKYPQMPSPLFSKEKLYNEMVFPNEEYRLLCLFRYWNIINYFFPYKYVIGEDWNNILLEMIPKFQFPKDTVDYHLAILEMTTKVNDSHASFKSKYIQQYFGEKYPPFIYTIIDNKAIVKGFLNDSIAEENDIQHGDVIIALNNKNLAEVINEKKKYIGASNEATKNRNLSVCLFNGSSDSCNITIEREGQILSKSFRLYSFSEIKDHLNTTKEDVCKELPDSIGYINMGVLTIKQVDSIMKIMMNKKAIIFDIRNYPNFTLYQISYYLNKEKRAFVKFTKPDFSYPGIFKWESESYCGSNNPNYFKGKVVLLFNENTQSRAEFTCMALQTAPNVKCIGSQTSGADGNVSNIPLPGGYYVRMTGLGVFYPDGRETQRIGIVPDIEVNPTIEGIKNKKDEVLERAIEYIIPIVNLK